MGGMSAALGHFLITRFNIPVPFKGSENRLRPEWLERRFELFERFCLPSVASQSTRDFTWLVLVDAETPSRFLTRLDGCRRAFPLRPLRVDGSWRDLLREEVTGLLPPGARHVLTSRLDSDDAVGVRFIESVRGAAQARDSGVFLFPRGFVWHEGRLYLRDYPLNPFATMLEPLQGFKTVFQADHNDLADSGEVVYLSEEPSWLQVVHGGNASNSLAGLRVWDAPKSLTAAFPELAAGLAPREGLLEWAADFSRSLRSWRGVLGPVRRAIRG